MTHSETADHIFKLVSTSGAESFKEAEQMIIMFYIPDMSYSRGGICLAIKRLRRFWEDKKNELD